MNDKKRGLEKLLNIKRVTRYFKPFSPDTMSEEGLVKFFNEYSEYEGPYRSLLLELRLLITNRYLDKYILNSISFIEYYNEDRKIRHGLYI